jgi:hypothetical protein
MSCNICQLNKHVLHKAFISMKAEIQIPAFRVETTYQMSNSGQYTKQDP